MGVRGRKSTAELAVATTRSIERPKPPAWMSKAEKAEWREIVKCKPPEWMTREKYPLLEAYCTHAVARRYYAARLTDLQLEEVSPKEVKEWSTMHDAQSKQINSLGIRLDIAQSTSYERNRRASGKNRALEWGK